MERERRTVIHQPEDMVWGRNPVRELLESGRDVDKILVASGDRDGVLRELITTARNRGIPVSQLDRRVLDAKVGHAAHQGIVAFAAQHAYASVDEILHAAEIRGEPPLLLLLDGVEDPHNLGALIRTADCSGAHGVIIPKRRSVGLTAAVFKASAGAVEHVPVARVTNMTHAVDELKKHGIWVYAADMDGSDYTSADLTGPCAIVLGGEGSGVSRLVREHCDGVLSLPLRGRINSLNVSAAGAVLLFEAVRQRMSRA